MIENSSGGSAISDVNPSSSNIPQATAQRSVGAGVDAPFDRQVVNATEGGATKLLKDSEMKSPALTKARERRASKEENRYRQFRALIDSILAEVTELASMVKGEAIPDEGAGHIVEIQDLLEKLYYIPWGDGECLKRVVLAIQSQTKNAEWKPVHVHFLKNSFRVIRARFNIDEGLVREVVAITREYDLDPFRGTIAEPSVLQKYRIQEVDQ